MNAEQHLLAGTADAVFRSLGPASTVAQHWDIVLESGLPGLLLAEDDGGFGAGWTDAAIVFRLAGYHAVALPVIEATLARRLAPPGTEGLGTIATSAVATLDGNVFTGSLPVVPWGRDAAYVIASLGDATILLGRPDQVLPGQNPAGEPRDTLIYHGAAAARLKPVDLLPLAALARTAQIAGALDAALAHSVEYSNARQQFGRALAKFQAVQQSLAIFAVEAAAVNCAAIGACHALDRGRASYEIAAAKLRANRAVGIGTAIAHQVHGAIGFTQEYGLHPLTRRLLAWRSEYGADPHWASLLGARVCARGAEHFWSDLTALADPVAPA